VTGCAILAILRHRLHCNCTSIALFRLAGPATFAGVIACALACALGLLGTLRSLLLRLLWWRCGGCFRPIWALIPGYCLRGLPLVGTRGGGGCYRGGRVCPCKQLTHRYQVIVVVVVGSNDWGGAAWKELLFRLGIPTPVLRALLFRHSRVPEKGHWVGRNY
jgi:hypothetical protein